MGITEQHISIPVSQYKILKRAYELGKQQQEMYRMYEVEENLQSGNYQEMQIDDFISTIR